MTDFFGSGYLFFLILECASLEFGILDDFQRNTKTQYVFLISFWNSEEKRNGEEFENQKRSTLNPTVFRTNLAKIKDCPDSLLKNQRYISVPMKHQKLVHVLLFLFFGAKLESVKIGNSP